MGPLRSKMGPNTGVLLLMIAKHEAAVASLLLLLVRGR